MPVITEDIDWPFKSETVVKDYATPAAGSATTTLYEPTAGRHGLVIWASSKNAAGITNGDFLDMTLDQANNVGDVAIFHCTTAGGRILVPLVQGVSTENALVSIGVSPVYVKYPYRLNLVHGTAGAGQNIVCSVTFVDLPDYQPIPLGL